MGRYSPTVIHQEAPAIRFDQIGADIAGAIERRRADKRREKEDQKREALFQIRMREEGYEQLPDEVLEAERKSGAPAGPPNVNAGPFPTRKLERAGNYVKAGPSRAEQQQMREAVGRQQLREAAARDAARAADQRRAIFRQAMDPTDAALFEVLPPAQAVSLYQSRHPKPEPPRDPVRGSAEWLRALREEEAIKYEYDLKLARARPRADADGPIDREDARRKMFIDNLNKDIENIDTSINAGTRLGELPEIMAPMIGERESLRARRDSVTSRIGTMPDPPAPPRALVQPLGPVNDRAVRKAMPMPAGPGATAKEAAMSTPNPAQQAYEADRQRLTIEAQRRIRSGQDQEAVTQLLARAITNLKRKHNIP